jgi:hypothetical protein
MKSNFNRVFATMAATMLVTAPVFSQTDRAGNKIKTLDTSFKGLIVPGAVAVPPSTTSGFSSKPAGSASSGTAAKGGLDHFHFFWRLTQHFTQSSDRSV